MNAVELPIKDTPNKETRPFFDASIMVVVMLFFTSKEDDMDSTQHNTSEMLDIGGRA